MNLIKKLRELRRRKFNRNWQQSGQSLARPQYHVLNSVCNNDCKRKPDTANPKHLVEIKHASSTVFPGCRESNEYPPWNKNQKR